MSVSITDRAIRQSSSAHNRVIDEVTRSQQFKGIHRVLRMLARTRWPLRTNSVL